jgi:PLP dependent protein
VPDFDAGAIAAGLRSVETRIRTSCERAGRDRSEVTLVCVSKTFPAEAVVAAARAGARVFGENRVQEGAAKIESLRPQLPDLAWHLIGPLQRNKVKKALQCFQAIETIDRMELAEKLEDLARTRVPVLVEINLGGEASKSGISPRAAEGLVRAMAACGHLDLRGLMTIPPYSDDPERTRSDFRALRDLRDRLRDSTGAALPDLSMGMSHDFPVAIEEGATIVRVGTAIFGARRSA